jgi:predicted Fe-Mo cluster-binding NifX family protein/FtsZ-binding cell division protein ZapB
MNKSHSKKVLLQQTLQQLEEENSSLKSQLVEAQALIDSLRKENQALTKRLSSYTSKPEDLKTQEKSPQEVPNNSLTKTCDLCKQEIPKPNFDLHQVQCMRKNTRCKFCNLIFPVASLENHLNDMKGNFEGLAFDVEEGNIGSLAEKEIHGCHFDLKEENEIGNSLLHVAVKCGRREVVQFLLNKGVDINIVNSFNESVLHVACGKLKDFSMLQFLVSKGADVKILNSMGDSAMDVAKRSGFLDAVLYFQNKVSVRTRPMSARQVGRPGTGINKLH